MSNINYFDEISENILIGIVIDKAISQRNDF